VKTVLAQLEVRCTACRDGLVGAVEWNAWYARTDEIEAAHLAEHGHLDGLRESEGWLILMEERPHSPEETECEQCAGAGVVLTDAGREVLAWAQRRLTAA
jgi:hypothetical protein